MKKLIYIILVLHYLNSNSQCWEYVSAGGNNSMAIKTDGTLWGTGQNNWGQVGIGGDSSNPPVMSFVQIDSPSQWQKVSTSTVYTLAIKADGTLWAWGYNSGTLGDGTTTHRYTPIQIGVANNWKDVSAHNSSFGIKTDGTLWGWGAALLGNGATTGSLTPIQIGTDTNWKTICRNINDITFAVKTNGTLWGWGNNAYGELNDGTTTQRYTPIQVGTDTNWKEVKAGDNFYVGLKTDGTLWSWGLNSFGELGNAQSNNFVITKIGTDNDWQKIAVSHNSFCLAIKTNGTLWAWGRNNGYNLGNGTNINQWSPIQIGTETDWKMVSCGGTFSVGIKTDNSMQIWGNNILGQLGNGAIPTIQVPTPLGSCDLGNEEFQKKPIIIYPNPTKSILNIESNSIPLSEMVVVNMLGEKMLEQKGDTNQIKVESLQKGIYLLQIVSEGETFNYKFVKE